MNKTNEAIEVFRHPNNIQIGQARILWGPRAYTSDGKVHEEGWVLPGGKRTTFAEEAIAWAKKIDNYLIIKSRGWRR